MVAISEKLNTSTTIPAKQEHPQTARIIQWLGGERAGERERERRTKSNSFICLFNLEILVDVPAEFDVTANLKEDFVDHHIVASKVECIELLRLKPQVSH